MACRGDEHPAALPAHRRDLLPHYLPAGAVPIADGPQLNVAQALGGARMIPGQFVFAYNVAHSLAPTRPHRAADIHEEAILP
ncbi:hypothetical protein [Calditerricola yamamurae]